MGNVQPPSGGLKSNSNYFLYGGGENLTNVSVVIDVTQDIVGNIGFGFQLNAYSPSGANEEDGWQQYFIWVSTPNGFPGCTTPGTLIGQIEPWPQSTTGSTPTTTSDLINRTVTLQSLSNSTIAKGYKLTIALGDDSSGNVRYVTFTVVDNNGVTQYNQKIDLVGLTLDTTGAIATTADLSPIIAFEVNLVGPINALQSFLYSGAGTITYSATNAMTVVAYVPAGKADTNWTTLEDTNSAYGELPTGSSKTFTQTFAAAALPVYTPAGPLAVSKQFGATSQTDVFAIDRAGQPVVFYVDGAGHWGSTTGIGPTGLARRGSALAACQQFGASNQTDLFVVGQNGQLNVFWVNAAGPWGGPQKIGSAGLASAGAPLAVSQQFGAVNQTDVFLVDNNGQLNVFWVNAAGPWGGPQKIGPKGLAPSAAHLAASRQFGAVEQTDVFVVDKNGQLNVFWVNNAGAWGGPEAIGPKGFAPAGAPLAACQQFGAVNQTDVFVVDNSGQLNVFWVNNAGAWGGPVAIGPTGFAPAGAPLAASQQFGAANQTDVFVVDNSGRLNVFWVNNAGPWGGPEAIGPKGVATAGAALAASQQFDLNQTDVFLLNQTGTNSPGWPVVYWVDNAGPWSGPKALVTEV